MKHQPDQNFEPAPLCRRIWMVIVLVCLVLGIVDTLMVIKLTEMPDRIRWVPLALQGLGPLIIVLIWWGARIQGYQLQGGTLVVKRRFRSPRFELEGLDSVALAPDVMKGAMKVIGNDGLGAISGRFKNRQWGTFHAYLSDTERAVALRWKSGTTVVVSPEHVMPFIDAVKRRLHA